MSRGPGVTRWWWVRHAPVTEDGGCVYGQIDVPCDCSDAPAFAALAARLPARALLVTSHLQRTRQTAEALAAAGAGFAQAVVEPDLAEQHFGEWQGRNRKEVFRDQAEWHGFWIAPAEARPPGGESFVELVARVAPAIERLTRAHAGSDIVAVVHGGTIRAALSLALDLSPAGSLSFSVDNLSLTRIDHIDGGAQGAGWRVGQVNVPANHAAGAAA